MATYYKILDTRNKTTEKFPLKIAISHKKKTRYIETGYYLTIDQWSPDERRITSEFKNAGRANVRVDRKYTVVGEVVESLRPYWKQLNVDQIKEAAEAKIAEEFQGNVQKEAPKILHVAMSSDKGDSTCIFEYSKKVVRHYYQIDQGGSARVIKDTLSNMKKYIGKDKLAFRSIDEEFLKGYERWYVNQFDKHGKKNSINGFGFKARAIRAIYNLAIKDRAIEDVINEMYPFGKQGYSIKKEKTDNKNIDPSEIGKIYDLRLSPGTKLWHHLNFFKYYFECWGMNFADIAHLRVHQVQNGRLKYRRRKTKWSNNAKKFDIEHSPIAQEIIDYYTRGKKPSDFVFPIIDNIFYLNDELQDKEQEEINKEQFENKFADKRRNHIRRLKTISAKAGLKNNVSIYVGRHSFFSIALQSGVSKSEISEMAGHSDFQVTENYLAGFSGAQLAAGANMVRMAVTKHTEFKGNNNLLEEEVLLNDTTQAVMVQDFLNQQWEHEQTPTNLLIALLQKTSCKDGVKAQQYVNAFISSQQEYGRKAS